MRRVLFGLLCLVPLASAHAQEPPEVPDEAKGPAVLTVETGGHSLPIFYSVFTPDSKRLVTVGHDRTVQIWDAATGQRLKVLRLPVGKKGLREWQMAVLSADGKVLALGGDSYDDGKHTHVLLVHLEREQFVSLLEKKDDLRIGALAFSAQGDMLAGALRKEVYVWGSRNQPLSALWTTKSEEPRRKELLQPTAVLQEHQREVRALAFAPAGDKLASASTTDPDNLRLWNVTAAGVQTPSASHSEAGTAILRIAWNKDGTSLVTELEGSPPHHGIAHWSADGKLLNQFLVQNLKALGSEHGTVDDLRFVAADQVLVSYVLLGNKVRHRFGATVVNLTDGSCSRTWKADDLSEHRRIRSVLSPDSKWLVHPAASGMVLVVRQVEDGKEVCRLGSKARLPYSVGWHKDAPIIGWDHKSLADSKGSKGITHAFDLAHLRLLKPEEVPPEAYLGILAQLGPWTLAETHGKLDICRDKERVRSVTTGFSDFWSKGSTLLEGGKNGTLVAYADPYGLWILDPAIPKATAGRLLPVHPYVTALATSADHKYLLVATGGQRLCIYSTESRRPLLNLVVADGDWIAWTEEGYYAATPGGEKMVGWTVDNGPEKPATFYAAERFRKQLYRPELIKLVLEKGSVAEALKALSAKPADVDQLLPPRATLVLVEKQGERVKVKATAAAGINGQTVTALRLLLDGRPWTDARGLVELKPSDRPEAEWTLEVPPGNHTLKVLVRGPETATVSDPVEVAAPLPDDQKPVLYLLAVGISKYQEKKLELECAASDADAITAAFESCCAGKGNRFRKVVPRTLTNEQATRAEILAAIQKVRTAGARPGDLVVVFFAGHGVKEDKDFYLLTVETKPNQLAQTGLAGKDLRDALKDMPCQVLLLLDACHSGAALQAFAPAVDDLTRTLTDEQCGVVVFCAALANETAKEERPSGYFTRSLIKGLQMQKGVFYNQDDHYLYLHHLHAFVFDEVKKLSKDTQHPFLNLPWVMESFPLRKLPEPSGE